MRVFGYEIKKAAIDPRMGNVMSFPWERGRDAISPFDFKALVNAYTSWVYICATKNAEAVAAATIKLYVMKSSKSQKVLVKTKPVMKQVRDQLIEKANLYNYVQKAVDVEEVLEHPILEVFKKVNPFINRFDLWFLTEVFLELTGNAYWYTLRDGLGMVTQIWPLPSQHVRVAIDKSSGLLGGYLYTKGMVKIPFEPEEIVHFKFGSPLDQIYGQGPLSAILETFKYDQSIRVFEDTLMRNMGRPEAVLETDQPVDKITFDRIKTEWINNYAGENKVGKTIILPKGLTYKGITMSPKDMQYIVARRMNREEIAAAFGVPMSKLTTEHVNLANANVGERQYIKDTIEPRLRRMEEKLNEYLIPSFDTSLFVAYGDILPEDQEMRMKERSNRLSLGYSSINEERFIDGFEAVPWGEVPLLPSSWVPLTPEGVVSEDDLKMVAEKVVTNIRRKMRSDESERLFE